MAQWATTDEVLALPDVWRDAITLDPVSVQFYLDVAQEVCEEYAPPLADGVAAPKRYKLAVMYHARDLQKNATDGVEAVGPDAYPLRVRPLSDAVRALLRPNHPVTRFKVPTETTP